MNKAKALTMKGTSVQDYGNLSDLRLTDGSLTQNKQKLGAYYKQQLGNKSVGSKSGVNTNVSSQPPQSPQRSEQASSSLSQLQSIGQSGPGVGQSLVSNPV